MPFVHFLATLLALTWCGPGFAQNGQSDVAPVPLAPNTVRTESIRPPAATATQPIPDSPTRAQRADAVPEIMTDPARLPEPVARMRARILDAARAGDLGKVVNVMQANAAMPIFSLADHQDPIVYWKSNYPDSEGVEVLAILVSILEAGFVHVDAGTPQEMYVWPYFARVPIKSLTPAQRVELFRIITGADYKDMLEFGAYAFYRLGIAPDGSWQYFVTGD